MSGQNLSAEYCPLCGKANLCDMAACGQGENCWCREERVPKALLAQIPESRRRQACICRDCIQAYNANYYDATGESG